MTNIPETNTETVRHKETLRKQINTVHLIVNSGSLAGQSYSLSRSSFESWIFVGRSEHAQVHLQAPEVSRIHVRLMFSDQGLRMQAVEQNNQTYVGSPEGAVLLPAYSEVILTDGSQFRMGDLWLRISEVESDMVPEVEDDVMLGDLRGKSSIMRKLFARFSRAQTEETGVLLTGETGVGKSAFAHTFHQLSMRRDQPFVTIHCRDRQFIESGPSFELDPKAGTTYFDGVEYLSADQQAALLNVLLNRTPGQWIICSGAEDMGQRVRRGKFDARLYHLISKTTLAIPPLKHRLEDIPILVEHFANVESFASGRRMEFSESALDLLEAQPWPGNLTELRDVVRGMALISRTEAIEGHHVTDYLQMRHELRRANADIDHLLMKCVGGALSIQHVKETALARIESECVRAALDLSNGSVSDAAGLIQCPLRTFRRLRDKL